MSKSSSEDAPKEDVVLLSENTAVIKGFYRGFVYLYQLGREKKKYHMLVEFQNTLSHIPNWEPADYAEYMRNCSPKGEMDVMSEEDFKACNLNIARALWEQPILLCDYTELPEEERQKNRSAVVEIIRECLHHVDMWELARKERAEKERAEKELNEKSRPPPQPIPEPPSPRTVDSASVPRPHYRDLKNKTRVLQDIQKTAVQKRHRRLKSTGGTKVSFEPVVILGAEEKAVEPTVEKPVVAAEKAVEKDVLKDPEEKSVPPHVDEQAEMADEDETEEPVESEDDFQPVSYDSDDNIVIDEGVDEETDQDA